MGRRPTVGWKRRLLRETFCCRTSHGFRAQQHTDDGDRRVDRLGTSHPGGRAQEANIAAPEYGTEPNRRQLGGLAAITHRTYGSALLFQLVMSTPQVVQLGSWICLDRSPFAVVFVWGGKCYDA